MRYILYLLALILLMSVTLAMPALADDECDGEESCCEQVAEASCPTDMDMMHMDMDGPWEQCWSESPWDSWGLMGERTLDFEAIHFMGNVRTIAILPFADNTTPTSQGDSRLDEAGGSRRIVENLAAEFQARGYLVIPPSDCEAVFDAYHSALEGPETQEVANNRFYFENMPERAMDFYLEAVPGLQSHYDSAAGALYYVSPDDIQLLGEVLGADCVIRGFVHEFAVTRDIDADWRTFVPPFLGLLNPDRRATIEVAYYMYDGSSGDMIWNGTVEVRDDANWPLFESESELLWGLEHDAVWQMTGRVLPNWMELVSAHPEWVPYDMWCEFEGEPWDDCDRFPGWLNPMRDGWHECYERHEMRWDEEPSEFPLHTRYRDLTGTYYHLRHP